jgi:hypothetical protein
MAASDDANDAASRGKRPRRQGAGVRTASREPKSCTSCTGPGRAAKPRACERHRAPALVELIRPDQKPGSRDPNNTYNALSG